MSLQPVEGRFTPTRPAMIMDFRLRKSQRWEAFDEWSRNINWSQLNEQEYQMQWGNLLNAIHLCENSQLITRDATMPEFVRYLRIMKYSAQDIATLKNLSDKVLTFSI